MNILICDDAKIFVDSLYLHVQEYMEKRYMCNAKGFFPYIRVNAEKE